MDNQNRIGFFTSSQMYRLAASLKSGKPSQAFYGYIDEVICEIEMGRLSSVEVKTVPMKWGNLMEVVLFNLLGMNYKMCHKQTIKHFKYNTIWSGTPDLISEGVKIGEIKSYQPKNFASLSLCLRKQSVVEFKNNFPKEYWQCVSNAILCKLPKAEIIAYMPYKDELLGIIKDVEESNFLEMNGLDPQDYYFLTQNDIETLPYLPDESKMSNVNSFEFEVPKEDMELLTERVEMAKEELLKLGYAETH